MADEYTEGEIPANEYVVRDEKAVKDELGDMGPSEGPQRGPQERVDNSTARAASPPHPANLKDMEPPFNGDRNAGPKVSEKFPGQATPGTGPSPGGPRASAAAAVPGGGPPGGYAPPHPGAAPGAGPSLASGGPGPLRGAPSFRGTRHGEPYRKMASRPPPEMMMRGAPPPPMPPMPVDYDGRRLSGKGMMPPEYARPVEIEEEEDALLPPPPPPPPHGMRPSWGGAPPAGPPGVVPAGRRNGGGGPPGLSPRYAAVAGAPPPDVRGGLHHHHIHHHHHGSRAEPGGPAPVGGPFPPPPPHYGMGPGPAPHMGGAGFDPGVPAARPRDRILALLDELRSEIVYSQEANLVDHLRHANAQVAREASEMASQFEDFIALIRDLEAKGNITGLAAPLVYPSVPRIRRTVPDTAVEPPAIYADPHGSRPPSDKGPPGMPMYRYAYYRGPPPPPPAAPEIPVQDRSPVDPDYEMDARYPYYGDYDGPSPRKVAAVGRYRPYPATERFRGPKSPELRSPRQFMRA